MVNQKKSPTRHVSSKLTDGKHERELQLRLEAAMEEVVEAIARGHAYSREALLEKYLDVAIELDECLESLKFVQTVAPHLATHASADGSAADLLPSNLPHRVDLGDFHILRELGRGGMGVVYEAEQLSMGRKVALKVLPFAALLDERQLRRFKNEARAAGSLHHPSIVPVFSVGTERGVHYYAMQLVDGPSLAEVIRDLNECEKADSPASAVELSRTKENADGASNERPQQLRQASSAVGVETRRELQAALSTKRSTSKVDYFRTVAQWGTQAAEALEYAHDNGVLHRDIKPGNLLLDGSGKLLVTDFGLARLESNASMTLTGDIVGTIRYMAPEQALAKRGLVDHRADIYSLGVTLYELATTRPAFSGHDRETLLNKLASEEPIAPTKIDASIPGDLETIILKASSKAPADRYVSAQDLADDLNRFLERKPIAAKPPTVFDRVRKWARRHQALSWSIATVLLLVSLASVFGFVWSRQKNSQLAQAVHQAEQNFDIALSAVDEMYLQLATRWIADESTPTHIQEEFLKRARSFYETVASQPISNPKDSARTARVYARIGQIEHFLENYPKADEALRRAIELGENLLNGQDATSSTLRRELARRYRMRAKTLLQMADISQATSACENGIVLLDNLRERDLLTPEDELEQISLQHLQAELALLAGNIELAEQIVRELRQDIAERQKTPPQPAELHVADIKNRYSFAKILLARKAPQASMAEATLAMSRLRANIGWNFGLERETIRVESQLANLMGAIAETKGELAQAADFYRQSLDIQRQNLRSQKAPIAVFATKMMGQKSQYETAAFCSYTETQLSLARVLFQLDRPYEAERQLGQCMLVSYIISMDRHNVLRYQIAEANAWAQASQVIVSRRPTEAGLILDHALQIWKEILWNNSHAASYHSGVQGQITDLEWFRSTLDAGRLSQLDSRDSIAVRTGVRELPKLAFTRNATARAWYDSGAAKSALSSFEESASLREADHAYAWLQLAAVHAKLGDASASRQWLSKAEEELNRDPHPELIQLRARTRSLVNDLSVDAAPNQDCSP